MQATKEQQTQVSTGTMINMRRIAIFSDITVMLTTDLMENNLPVDFNKAILVDTINQLNKFSTELRAHTDEPNNYLAKVPSKEKLNNIFELVDVMARIGHEEGDEQYEDFLGLSLDMVDAIFYGQKVRKGLHFPKYKALFELFNREMNFDINKTANQIQYSHGQLYFRTAPPVVEPKIQQ